MRHAIGLPTVGQFGSARTLVDLAVAAERHGWDGVHLWDHLLYDEPDWPVTSPTVAAAAIAAATSRVRIILTVTVPRRQVQEVAQDTAALAELSGGRLTLVATLGSIDEEYTAFGLDPDLRARGRALDERLARLQSLWREWGKDPVPIWCAARWPRTVGLRRASRFAGAMPIFDDQRSVPVPVADVSGAAALVPGKDLALEGFTDGPADAERLRAYADAGVTWWIEALGWWRGDLAAARARIAAGPPGPAGH
ncbi:LLM class flavin-dependent oxidoreductase [Dactylosporangium sp. CA-233914]|uniref:LLM class flavin-dependent oxidoreductase n=1 Tax=Dactylosporangium sp. CA-233914 TaxID=3239934 RepID=UPI003D927C02